MNGDQGQYTQTRTWNEIMSQGRVWQSVLDFLRGNATVGEVLSSAKTKRLWVFVGCGTSFYLAEAAALSWTLLTGQPARAIPASEILLFPKLLEAEGEGVQAVVISRSGRTSEAVRAANVLTQQLGISTIGISCAKDSELEQASDRCIVLEAANEESMVMTRSFTSMLMTLQVLAARQAEAPEFIDGLRAMSVGVAQRSCALADQMKTFVAGHKFSDYVFLGQGPFHGLAREAALKVMEMSCSYSQFFHALEFRHGPKAIVSPATCLTFFLSESGQEAEAEVLAEMKELGGTIVAIANRTSADIRKSSDLVIELEAQGDEMMLLVPYIVPCQLMGFFTGLSKGLNPDAPKNLSHVVILD